MLLLKLFFAFIQVGLFSVGGGYAAIPLIQEQIVNNFTTIQNTQAGTDENTIVLMLGTADLYEKIDDISEKLDSLTRKEG